MRSKNRLVDRLFSLLVGLCGVLVVAAAAASDPIQIRFSSISWNAGEAVAQDGHGHEVSLGLDPELQNALTRILTQAQPIAGAATLVDARSGQILAAAEIGHDPGGSLLFEAVAPAASLFKIVTTAALYEHTDVTPMTRVCTRGGMRDILLEHLTPAVGPGTTCTRFAQALGVSRNAVFAQLATQKLTRDDLIDTAQKLGFGSPLQIDGSGTMGTIDVPYNDLEFARTAAGFENTQLSVFGAAQLALTVASGGLVPEMHLQKQVSESSPKSRALSPRTARRLRDAMEVTIHSGTARTSFVDERGHSTVGPVQVAGKTGTLKPAHKKATSSWFIGFAPSDNPRVVVSVLLQNPDEWYRKGHQVGRDLIGAYLKKAGVKGIVR